LTGTASTYGAQPDQDRLHLWSSTGYRSSTGWWPLRLVGLFEVVSGQLPPPAPVRRRPPAASQPDDEGSQGGQAHREQSTAEDLQFGAIALTVRVTGHQVPSYRLGPGPDRYHGPAMSTVTPEGTSLADLEAGRQGVLPSQLLSEAVKAGWVQAGGRPIPEDNIQPGSIDLRLGDYAYATQFSFLPGHQTVGQKLADFKVEEIDLERGAVLEIRRPYLVPLVETLELPAFVRGKANPKSSTGRLDVFTRVITDGSYRFDEIAPGYKGQLWVEIVPLSFAVRVRSGLALNQLRLMAGRSKLSDEELWAAHQRQPLLYINGRPAGRDEFATQDGLFLSLDLKGAPGGWVGYRAKRHTPLIDMSKVAEYRSRDYWETVRAERGGRVVLDEDCFFLLLSEEAVQVPPDLACEMIAYDPTRGELRTHYAGFFDPGFGYDRTGLLKGSRAALEVRAHDVPFLIDHGQHVCKLTFERMASPPSKLYGDDIGSNYQGQVDTLSKHFRREAGDGLESKDLVPEPQLDLFGQTS
jgi:dCTP deaminase